MNTILICKCFSQIFELCHAFKRPIPYLYALPLSCLLMCVVIRNKYWVLRGSVVSPPPNPQARGPPTVGCPRLLIQYIHSYPPYLEAVSSIRNPRTYHAVETVDPLNMDFTELHNTYASLYAHALPVNKQFCDMKGNTEYSPYCLLHMSWVG
jgi:hypothetical protein